MKSWWLTTGWPWLKANWWVLLILPVMLLVAIGMRLYRREVVVVDPTGPADERARTEAELRIKQLEAERARLQRSLTELEATSRALMEKFEERLAEEVEALRKDPERLRQLMLETGQGR
jgi:hypothetical protein